MSRRNSRQGSSIESGPSRRQPGRRGIISPGTAVTVSTAILAAGILYAANGPNDTHPNAKPQKNTPSQKSTSTLKSPLESLKAGLTNAYIPGSVRLTSASVTGAGSTANYYPANRETVQAHIDYKLGSNKKLLAVDGDPLPPKEVVVASDGSTRPGVINWAEYPSTEEVNMLVELRPFSGDSTVTKKYRLFLTAMDTNGLSGKPIATESYAGTVDISGKNGNLETVKVEHEADIPQVRLIYPTDPTLFYGVPNDDPNNG